MLEKRSLRLSKSISKSRSRTKRTYSFKQVAFRLYLPLFSSKIRRFTENLFRLEKIRTSSPKKMKKLKQTKTKQSLAKKESEMKVKTP